MNKTSIIIVVITMLGITIMNCQPTAKIPVIKLPVKNDPTVSFRLWFKVGSQNDPADKEGLASLTANLMTEGSTVQNSYEEIVEKLYPMAASYGSQVDKEMTVITGRVHRDNLDEYYQLLREAVITPAFKQEDFERVKSDVLNYLDKSLRYSDDEEFGEETLSQFIFTGTPYAHPEEGLIESVKSITLDDVKDFYQTYFTKDNLVIGIGGGFNKAFTKKVVKDMADLPAGVPSAVPKPEPEPINGREVLLIENGMAEDDFELTKKFLKNYCLHFAPTTNARLGYKLDDAFYGVSGGFLESFRNKMNALTLDEVNAAIKKYLQYENMKIVMITPNAFSLKQDLLSDKPSPMTYSTPKPEKVLQEDKEIANYPLNIKAVTIKRAEDMFMK